MQVLNSTDGLNLFPKILLGLLALCLSSCAQISERATTEFVESLPAEFSAKKQAPTKNSKALALDEWWRAFGISSLDSYLEKVWAQNLTIRSAYTRVIQAEGRLASSRSSLWPQLSLAAGIGRNRTNVRSFSAAFGGTGANGPNAVTNTRYSISTPLSYELDLWGRLSDLRSAADKEYQLSQFDFLALLNSLAAETVDTYLRGIELCQQKSLIEKSIKSDESVYQIVLRRYQSGLSDSLEIYEARETIAARKALLPDIERQLFENRTQLKVLAGEYPSTLLACDASVEFPTEFPEIAASSPAKLLEQRPDLQAARAQLLAADYRYSAAVKNFLPGLSLSFSPGYEDLEFSRLFQPETFVWNLAVNLSQALFDGGKRKGELLTAEARSAELFINYVNASLVAFSEVENAINAEHSARESFLRKSENAEAAAMTFSVASKQYAQGLADYVSVLFAQVRKLQAERDVVSARRQILSTRVALARALGGSWGVPATEAVEAKESLQVGSGDE